MRVLITGGAGCLGSNLFEKYLDAGHQVCVIDNFATGRREVIPYGLEGFHMVEGTIADPALVQRCFEEFEPTHVIHSAAAYKDPDDWLEDVATNIKGTIHVVDAARTAGVRRFVNFQTALCYGKPDQVPIPVDHFTRPTTSYGISKTAGEEYLALSGLSYVSVRLASVVGPRLAIGAIPTFYTRLKNGQSCFCADTVRDFLDMSDFFAFMDLATQEGTPTGIFNLGPGEGHSIKEIFDVVVEHLDIELREPVPVVPPAADDIQTVILDSAETTKAFGWRAQVPFRQAIGNMLQWYDRHGVTAIYSHLKGRKV